MKTKGKFLAAKVVLVAAMTTGSVGTLIAPPVHAGIPVIDGGNLAQNIMSAMEAVAQTSKQIQQYQTQLKEYENMLLNSVAPAAYIWDQAQSTINDLVQATNTLQYYQNQLGSLDRYLGKFNDVAYYRSSPCYTSSGCTPAEKAAMEENRRLASESQKKANDALFKGLEKQQNSIKADARQLQRLQGTAQTAQGQLEAIGYANQLASNQTNQLLQIRGLLIAQQNATATRMQVVADREAQHQAASEQLRRGSFAPSPSRSW
ncbi:P-type conjugative transfer protein TrbJ [Vibrio diabolicus]|uniref:P-type conjugative transfer protein TrbJ n=1 Tax=Vibrio diabolicus TaxID=50719 RepID=UPI00193C22A3|nr:P-type conjugative transfer protein TrbJ [Vibrio diabolicus]HCH1696708.1 P-type conjugative transfer protein TrbJ [Vibrio parahaemolyticus]